MKRLFAKLAALFGRKKAHKDPIDIKIDFRQSFIFELIKNTEAVHELMNPKLNTQASKHRDSNLVKIVFMDQKAYWIKDNVFYTADVSETGSIDIESTSAVDTMTMDKIQLDKMSFIVDKLTEGS